MKVILPKHDKKNRLVLLHHAQVPEEEFLKISKI
jgi:hypothetical protein